MILAKWLQKIWSLLSEVINFIGPEKEKRQLPLGRLPSLLDCREILENMLRQGFDAEEVCTITIAVEKAGGNSETVSSIVGGAGDCGEGGV